MKKVVSLMIVSVMLLATLTLGITAANTNVKAEVKVAASKIEKIEGDCSIKIIYPVFSGFNSATKLNDIVQNKNADSIGFVRAALPPLQEIKDEQKKEGIDISNMGVAVDSSFDYNQSGGILSVLMNTYSYTGGAHGLSVLDAFTVNTKTDEIYTFNSLFNQNSSYKKVILNKINTMIDKEKDLYFDDAKQAVAKRNYDYQFYIDGSNLVIYFGLYDLRPYAGGFSVFTIEAKELKGLLKDEVYTQMINAKPLTKFRLNGTSFTVPYKAYEQNYTLMVPLKYLAEMLGYKVGWDLKNGASLEGGYIKDDVNSYYTDKTKNKPIKLGLPAKIVNKVMYVPIDYFSMVLNEDVSYYADSVKIFKIAKKEETPYERQIVEFSMPNSDEECAKMYATAVQERNGAIQYALFSEKLRAATISNFEALNWVTGVSSPWVTSYDIKNTGKGTYDIVFHWTTSAGKVPDSTTKITVENAHPYWQITGIQE